MSHLSGRGSFMRTYPPLRRRGVQEAAIRDFVVGDAAVGGGRQWEERSTPATRDAYVKFSNVQKTYDGETLVVKKLNLEIGRGEFLTMLGPSGSGKTTTLMMLAGFEVPTHGSILLEGRSIDNMPPHKRDIGMVFQNYALFPHMTVEENLAFPSRLEGWGERRPRPRSSGRSTWSGSVHMASGDLANFPAASSSVSRLRARSFSIPSSYLWMSRSER